MLTSIKNFFAHLFKKRRKLPSLKTWPKMGRDWNILLLSFFLLLFLSIALNGILFLRISRGEIFLTQKAADDSGLSLDRDLLKTTLDFYENRARNFADIKAHPPASVDPSI